MIKKVFDFIKKYFVYIAFFLIILAGIFLRTYNFSDWLHFELDQARDASVISKAIKGGASELPLLGPRAQGTFLRLGPAFYYLSYLSAKIFGNSPAGIARGVWLLSILTLPLLYLYFRRYFDRKVTLALTLLMSVSVFLVMYSRFAWNPNMLVFFVPLSFYALLRSVDVNEKNRGGWLIACFLSLAITTQLHFLAFLILPAVFLVFLAVKRPKIRPLFWTLGILSAFLVYAPVVINEVQTGGDNAEEFFGAVAEKSDKNTISLPKKIFFSLKEHSAGYFLLLSGRDGNSLLGINLNGIADNFRECEGEDCPQDYYLGLVSVIFLVLGFALLLFRLKKEIDVVRKDFLTLNGIFFLTCFAVFTSLALSISPRFFLLNAFLPFIFLGLFFEAVPKKIKLNIIIPGIVLALLVFSNGKEIKNRFSELAASNKKNISIETDLILKEKTRVTYAQEQSIARYMLESQGENGYPILFFGETRYVSALAYILEQNNALFNDRINRDKIYRYANYFWIDFTKTDGRYTIGKKEESFYDIAEVKSFGTLTVLRLAPKAGKITDDHKIFDEGESRSSAPKRFKWSELF